MTTQYIYNMVDTWNDGATTFTSIKMDVTDSASNAASLLMDLQLGSSSKFNVDKAGIAYSAFGFGYCAGNTPASIYQYAQLGSASNLGLGLSSSSPINWYQNTPISGAADTILTRRGAANLRLGAADAASGVQAQTLSVQSITGTNVSAAAYPFTITGSQGTGNAAGGSIIFQVAPLGSSGSAQNALATALTIDSTRKLTFADGGAQAYIDSGGRASFYSLQITAGSGIASPWVTMADNTLGVNLSNAAYLSWCDNANAASGTADVRLYRDTTATLALRNGTTAQTFNVYNTYTDASNYERLEMSWSGSIAYLQTANAGTGVNRALVVHGRAGVIMQSQGASIAQFTGAGFTFPVDNAYDIGASSATRPRSIYAGTSIISGGASGVISSGYLGSWVYGRIGFTNAATLSPSSTLDTYISRSAAGILAITDAAELTEMTAPASPAANGVRIYAVDNGSGKTQLMALFATGVAQQIAIQP